ncbi:hypothetical protein AAFC00_004764 [Neodothiora populina]|uniref:CMP/dCMP-type deaminase domain-containing protein n=1 Tax=Neodothiora populina TaxID=2781224 RepID=A0ABR3P348_9PEZI
MTSHEHYMRLALSEAKKSPPKPTNFCVGALLVSPSAASPVLATGYTLELPGNTHAEQCCFAKFATDRGVAEADMASVLPDDAVLYTTMEPCNLRLSGNLPCVDRVLQAKIRTVCIGVNEPEKFVGENQGRRKLEDARVKVIHVSGLEDEILSVATAGHQT